MPEALAEARVALGSDERDPWSHFAYGIVLWRMRRHGEAERAFRRTREWNPNFALAHAQLALPLAVRGAHEEAEDSAAGALRLSPSDALVDAFASHAMALAHSAAGHYPDAVAWARGARNWRAARARMITANGAARSMRAACNTAWGRMSK